MNAKKLQSQIEESLLRGLSIQVEMCALPANGTLVLTVAQVRELLRERAANLASAYADLVTDPDIDVCGFTVVKSVPRCPDNEQARATEMAQELCCHYCGERGVVLDTALVGSTNTVTLDMTGEARRERKREHYRKQSVLEEHRILAKLRSEQWCVKIDAQGNWEAHRANV